nr:hypothetical protein BACY1_08610 [Tenacibaculum mesophilum]
MDELHECQYCGHIGDDKDFQTDVDICQDADDMTCEACYDRFDGK